MLFPPGKAPLVVLLTALVTGSIIFTVRLSIHSGPRPDLVFAIFARNHVEAYVPAVEAFEEEHGVSVEMQLVNWRPLQNRLQAAFFSDSEAPDVVEISSSIGMFARGPLDKTGFLDLTDRIEQEGIRENLVESRLQLWTSRGRVFGLPHDVHPVGLTYRADIIEELGIDVEALDTWDKFMVMAREVTADLDGDGITDRYAICLSDAGDPELVYILLPQRGVSLFDANGFPAFNTPEAVETIMWYSRIVASRDPVSFHVGDGQPLAKAVADGLILFHMTPDWRTKQFEIDMPRMAGNLRLMPLPAFEKGGCRTSSWGGTGIAITQKSPNRELAWEFVKYLYLEDKYLGQRFLDSNIIPPVKSAWDRPEFSQPNAFYGGQPIGKLFTELAPQTPVRYSSYLDDNARNELKRVVLNANHYYRRNGEWEFREFVEEALHLAEDNIMRLVRHNRFLFPQPELSEADAAADHERAQLVETKPADRPTRGDSEADL